MLWQGVPGSHVIRRPFLLFFFFVALLFGPAFNLQRDYTGADNPDMQTYLNMARGEYNESPIRRYRWIIPTLAAGIQRTTTVISPEAQSETLLRFSFFLVNLMMMAGCGCLLYLLLNRYGFPSDISLATPALVLLTRWGIYFSAIPIVDSLYLLCTLAMLLGIEQRRWSWFIASVLIGPLARESFFIWWLAFPFFAWLRTWRILPVLLASVALFWVNRWTIDQLFDLSQMESIVRDLAHIGYIKNSLASFFSPAGILELVMILGPWWLLAIARWLFPRRERLTPPCGLLFFAGLALLHALLSTSIGRMLYLALPLWAWLMADSLRMIRVKLQNQD